MKQLATALSLALLASVAQAQTDTPTTYWMHNGSVVWLQVSGDGRTFYYSMPRPGMLKAGARPNDTLFEGKAVGNRYVGEATIYNPKCGQHKFAVSGSILNDGSKVVLKGRSPRFNRNCKIRGTRNQTWTFTLIEPVTIPAEFQGIWKLKMKGEPDACKTSEYRNTGVEHWPSLFRVKRRSVDYWHSSCDFVSIKRDDQNSNAVSVEMSCGGEGISWSSKGIWSVHDGFLSMSVVYSVSSDQEGKLEKGGIGSELAVRCTDVPERTDIPVMPQSSVPQDAEPQNIAPTPPPGSGEVLEVVRRGYREL